VATDVCIHVRAPDPRVRQLKASDRAYRSPERLLPHFAVRESTSAGTEEILGRFSDARCLLECALRSLNARDDSDAGVEVVCLRHGLELLRAVYNDLDIAFLQRSPAYGTGTADSDMERQDSPTHCTRSR
jgi:hypothetical protein